MTFGDAVVGAAVGTVIAQLGMMLFVFTLAYGDNLCRFCRQSRHRKSCVNTPCCDAIRSPHPASDAADAPASCCDAIRSSHSPHPASDAADAPAPRCDAIDSSPSDNAATSSGRWTTVGTISSGSDEKTPAPTERDDGDGDESNLTDEDMADPANMLNLEPLSAAAELSTKSSRATTDGMAPTASGAPPGAADGMAPTASGVLPGEAVKLLVDHLEGMSDEELSESMSEMIESSKKLIFRDKLYIDASALLTKLIHNSENIIHNAEKKRANGTDVLKEVLESSKELIIRDQLYVDISALFKKLIRDAEKLIRDAENKRVTASAPVSRKNKHTNETLCATSHPTHAAVPDRNPSPTENE